MARRSRKQKKQDQYVTDATSAGIDGLSSIAGIGDTINSLLASEVGTRQKIVAIQKTQNGLAKSYVSHVKKALTELNKFPGAFDAAAKAMTNQKKKEDQEDKKTKDKQINRTTKLAEAIKKAFNNNALVKGIKTMIAPFEGLLDKMPMLGKAAKGIFAVGAAAAGGFFSFIISSMLKFNERIDKVGKAFGYLAQGGNGSFYNSLNNAVRDTKLIGGNMDDVLQVVTTMSGQFGIGLTQASRMATEAVKLAKGLGISNEEAGKFTGMMDRIYGLTSQQRVDFVDITKNLAIQRGVNPGKVIQTMASASIKTQLSTGLSAKNLRNAAIAATDAGIELNAMAEGSDRLLDLQNSFTDEMVLNTMLNQAGIKGVNLEQLRQLKNQEDMQGMMGVQQKMIQRITKSQGFSNLSAFQQNMIRKNIGKAVGLELDAVVKLQKEQNQLADVTKTTKDHILDMSMANLESQLQNIMGPVTKFKNTLKLALEILGQALFKQFAPKMDEITEKLTKFITTGGLEEMARKFGNIAKQIVNVINNIERLLDNIDKYGIYDTLMGNTGVRESAPAQQKLGIEGEMQKTLLKQIAGREGGSETAAIAELKRLSALEAGELEAESAVTGSTARLLVKAREKQAEIEAHQYKEATDRTVFRNQGYSADVGAFTNRPQFHDLPAGVFAEAQLPNTPVNITSTGDPEGILRKSTVEALANNTTITGNEMKSVQDGLVNVENAINNLSIETVITGDQLKVLLHRAGS